MKRFLSWKKALITLGVLIVTACSFAAYGYVNAERLGSNRWFLDEIGLWFGSLPDSKMYYNTLQTPDSLTIGVSTDSNQVVVMEFADLGTDAAIAKPAYPSVTVASADLNHWISQGSDGTNGIIDVPSGVVSIPDGVLLGGVTMAGDLEMADNNINMGTALLDAGDFTMIDGAQTGDDEVVFAMSGDGSGDFSVTTDDGHITLAANDDVYLTPTGNDVIITGRAEITSGAAEAFRLLTNATDYTGFTMDANGGMAIASVDDAAAAANISITADGTYAVTSTGYNLSGAGAVSGVTTITNAGLISNTTGAAEALRLSTNATDYTGFTLDANGGLAITSVDAAAAAADIAVTADGTYAVTSTSYNLTGAGAVSGLTGIANTGELDMTGALALIDLNPASTGSGAIVDLTPTATLAAASYWSGFFLDANALDPLTGGATSMFGFSGDFTGVVSADGDDAQVYGTYMSLPTGDTADSYGHAQLLTEMTVAGRQIGFGAIGGTVALSATAQHDGLWVDWDGITRDGGAPIMHGVTVNMMNDYTAFGTSYAGYFAGEGRSVTLADTTYAMDASGDSRFVLAATEILLIEGDATRTGTNEVLDIDATFDTTTGTNDVPAVTSTVTRAALDTGGTYNFWASLTTGNMQNGELSYMYGGSYDSSAAVTATSTAATFFAGSPTTGASSNDYGLMVDTGYDEGIHSESPISLVQASDALAMEIDSEATTVSSYGLHIQGVFPLMLAQDITNGIGMSVSRDLAEAGSFPLVLMLNDNTSDTQATLSMQNDGSGPHISTGDTNENLEVNPNGTGHSIFMTSNGDAAQDVAALRNDDLGATGETAQTSELVFEVMASADSGSTWTAAEAASISAYKVADFWTAGGAADSDAGLKFYTTDAGTPTLALTIDNTQHATFVADILGTNTGDLGWSVQTGVNTACTTTCTHAAVFGVDSGGAGLIVGPTDATAEECVCAGPS